MPRPLRNGPLGRVLAALASVRRGELPVVLAASAYSFLVLFGYYILRPLRDEIGATDREFLATLWKWTFGASLVAIPLYAALVARFPRRVFLPLVYAFFALNMLAFHVLLRGLEGDARLLVERTFYVWLSVFNLFALASFWGFMADLFRSDEGKRLFGLIAAGGTLGGVSGSAFTALLAERVAPVHLLLPAAAAIGACGACARLVERLARRPTVETCSAGASELGRRVLSGIGAVFRSPYLLGIGSYVLLMTFCNTIAYFEQSHILAGAETDRGARTALLARMDLLVNVLTASAQLLATSSVLRWIGVGPTLVLLPALNVAGLLWLGLAPNLSTLVVFVVARRAGNFALTKPAREVLFTVVEREQKYAGKAFLDTVVYRGGDALSAQVFDGLLGLGLSLGRIALVSAPVAAVWGVVGLALGRRQEALARGEAASADEHVPVEVGGERQSEAR